ncbi:hypothetical protein ACFQZJ_01315 [Maribacter chungangensis]|uniref:TonB C-terminal domain-containing protein n=1 Tax=Maribacter chungangensis TaxID=1069117 RepID=A0ABW3AYI9_9FLAO
MKNWVKILLFSLLGLGLMLGGVYMYTWYTYYKRYVPSTNVYMQRVGYIDPDIAVFSEGFEPCGDYIFDYYNPERARYGEGKNGLRKFILNNFNTNDYTESGYLNIRFVINCKGETGRYVLHENDLNLVPKRFNPKLKEQLLKLTLALKNWNPNVINGNKVDSYMYISYRIEDGKITEIIP